MSKRKRINTEKLPSHIAVIMDGNGRWARLRNLDRILGHQHGVDAVRNLIEAAAELGIKYLTLYAFSTENWRRSDKEVSALMGLMIQSLNKETDTLIKNNNNILTNYKFWNIFINNKNKKAFNLIYNYLNVNKVIDFFNLKNLINNPNIYEINYKSLQKNISDLKIIIDTLNNNFISSDLT